MSPLQTRYSHLHDEPRYSWAPMAITVACSVGWAAVVLRFAYLMGWLS